MLYVIISTHFIYSLAISYEPGVKEKAAHMILLDDHFATIAKTIRECRRIFDNIRKFIEYTLTSNAGELSAIFLTSVFFDPQ